MNKYLTQFFLFIILVAGGILLYKKMYVPADLNITWYLYAYFCIITLLFHYGIVATTKARPQVFIRYYMAATTIKLLLHLGIIIWYSFVNRPMATRFILTFMIIYVLFTVFEIIAVWRQMRR